MVRRWSLGWSGFVWVGAKGRSGKLIRGTTHASPQSKATETATANSNSTAADRSVRATGVYFGGVSRKCSEGV